MQNYFHNAPSLLSSIIIRPPDIGLYLSADLGFTAILSSIFLSFFATYPPSSLNGTQPKTGHVLESAIWKCMSKFGVHPPPTNRWPKTPFFDDFTT